MRGMRLVLAMVAVSTCVLMCAACTSSAPARLSAQQVKRIEVWGPGSPMERQVIYQPGDVEYARLLEAYNEAERVASTGLETTHEYRVGFVTDEGSLLVNFSSPLGVLEIQTLEGDELGIRSPRFAEIVIAAFE